MPMTPLDRKVALIRRGVSMADVAADLDVSRQFVSDVVRGNRRSDRVEEAVAKALGLPRTEVFPPEVAAA